MLTGDDGRRAVDEGAAAIVVSNHGGRQLDCVSATLRALPEVVAAVNGRTEVFMDGGVRRGTDIVKAICLGARAVLCGRAYAYGLAAAGEPGVARALEILREDVQRTLVLLGCPSVSRSILPTCACPRTGRRNLDQRLVAVSAPKILASVYEIQSARNELRKHIRIQHHDHADHRRQRHRVPEHKPKIDPSLPT